MKAPKFKPGDAAVFRTAAQRVDVADKHFISPTYAISLQKISDARFMRCFGALDDYYPCVSVYGGTATMAPQFTRGHAVVALLLLAAIAEDA